jgi:hypothetical protein
MRWTEHVSHTGEMTCIQNFSLEHHTATDLIYFVKIHLTPYKAQQLDVSNTVTRALYPPDTG